MSYFQDGSFTWLLKGNISCLLLLVREAQLLAIRLLQYSRTGIQGRTRTRPQCLSGHSLGNHTSSFPSYFISKLLHSQCERAHIHIEVESCFRVYSCLFKMYLTYLKGGYRVQKERKRDLPSSSSFPQ